MATRKNDNEPQKIPDSLIVTKANFTEKLLQRIDIGKELFERSVSTVEGLDKNKEDYYKWDSYNSEFLKSAFNNENNSYKYAYDHVNFSIISGGWSNNPSDQLAELKQDIKRKVNELEELIEKTDLLKSTISEPLIIEKQTTVYNGPEIFLVHGHNSDVLQTVARTIEKLKLKPIILNEQPNAGRTLIEKFESHSNVGFAIVLLTDDDEGKAKTSIDLKSRARQNVILELGYFIGKLGRQRVLPLYSPNVELPSDIHGLLYVPIDPSGTWKFSIAKELNHAGYTVDANALL